MIRLESVSKGFGDKTILNEINLAINPGEVTFIVGSSGAGKSTLLNLIGGLDRVSSGKIFYNEKDITKQIDKYRADSVGFIFQDFNLISGLSAKQNVELALMYSGKNNADIEAGLEHLGIKDNKQSVETLSGGEKQRVAIVRSICKNSEIIIADEPTGNLDSKNAHAVFELIVNMKQGRHIVIVSHDMEMARKYGDRIITLSDGNVISDERLNTEIVQNTENSQPQNNRGTIKKKTLSSVIMVGLNSVRTRLSKIISIALVIALTLSTLALVFDFNRLGNSVSQNVNVNYLENDLISIYYPNMANLAFKETPFNEETVTYIKEKYQPKEMVPIYLEQDMWLFSNEYGNYEGAIKQINLDDFFQDRIMSYDIEGNFPQNKDEIIIAKDVAEALFEGDCIGKEIVINNFSGSSVTCEIVGINNTVNPYDNIYTVVSSDKIKELYENAMLETFRHRLEMYEYMEQTPGLDVYIQTGGLYGSVTQIEEDDVCIVGEVGDKSNEILISSALFVEALSMFGIEVEDQMEQMEALSQEKLVINYNGAHEIYVTGVFESDKWEIKLNEALITDLKSYEPKVLEVYASKKLDVSAIKETIERDEEFTCYLQLESLKLNLSQQTGFFKLALTVIGIVMIFVSICMLASFSKLVVLERRKEIAVLKSLGATNGNVRLTLWFDSVIISLSAFVFALILTKVLAVILPLFVKDMSYIHIEYPIAYLVMLGILFFVFICIYTAISMQKLVKKMPAELFKE